MASFPTMMSTWVQPFAWRGVQVVTTASPLASISSMFTAGDVSAAATASNPALPSLWQMLIGQRQGSLGEVCALALLLGFAYLLIRRVITPVIPLTYIGTVAVIMLIAGKGASPSSPMRSLAAACCSVQFSWLPITLPPRSTSRAS